MTRPEEETFHSRKNTLAGVLWTLVALLWLTSIVLWAAALITSNGTLGWLGGLISVPLAGPTALTAWRVQTWADDDRDRWDKAQLAIKRDYKVQHAEREREYAEATRDEALKKLTDFRRECICKEIKR